MSGIDQSQLAAPTANPRAGKAGSVSGRPSGEANGFDEVLAKTGQGASGSNLRTTRQGPSPQVRPASR